MSHFAKAILGPPIPLQVAVQAMTQWSAMEARRTALAMMQVYESGPRYGIVPAELIEAALIEAKESAALLPDILTAAMAEAKRAFASGETFGTFGDKREPS